MSREDTRATPGRTRVAFPYWVGGVGHVRELIRVVQLIATDAFNRATAEMAASEPERRAAWVAELSGVDRSKRNREWELLESKRREDLKEHYKVTMQANEGVLGNAWSGDALETLDRADPSRLRVIYLFAGEGEGADPWRRRIEVALSSACGSVLVLVGPAEWMARAQAAVAPVLRPRVPWYSVLRTPAASVAITLGFGFGAWLVFDALLTRSLSLFALGLASLVTFVASMEYNRVLNWAAPPFEVTAVGGRPRSLLRLPLVAASGPLWLAVIAAIVLLR